MAAYVIVKSYRFAVEKKMIGGLARAMENVGQLLENRARIRADNPIGGGRHPYVRTGDLVKSITHKVTSEDNSITAHISAGGITAPYAPIIELGNSRQPPYPFLFPAIESSREDIIRMLARIK